MIVERHVPCSLILKNSRSLSHRREKFGTYTAVLKRVHHATLRMPSPRYASRYLKMATCRISENLSVKEVLERLDAINADPSIVCDSSESEIEDDEVVAVFPENSVGIEDNSGESPSLSEECEFSSKSEVANMGENSNKTSLDSFEKPLAEHVVV